MSLLLPLHPRITIEPTGGWLGYALKRRLENEGDSSARPLEPSELLPTLHDGATLWFGPSYPLTGPAWGLLAAHHILGDVGWADWTFLPAGQGR
ncbi:uncharacterized protein PgNI_01001 [Pyricularia grisea]|uniref:Uncharacterized protein n=1 Tax=Pyricularia grisea TaxID=148305 RepID=A0A6P8BK77_PYRGI|nr:uncharacterized protein PgNI_01001 [Pyricularia grisea]TLD17080.1 hypothetical protein PgNI_01001 [Pyricularia grisea]